MTLSTGGLAQAIELEGDGHWTAYATGVNVGPEERARRAADWKCKACKRGEADGAAPWNRRAREGGKRGGRWVTKGLARLCARCARRMYLLRQGKIAPPPDMPDGSGGRRGGHADRAALRLYWERKIWDAAARVFEIDTGEERDGEFREARREFFALVAMSSRYLDPGDYTLTVGGVPRLPWATERHEEER